MRLSIGPDEAAKHLQLGTTRVLTRCRSFEVRDVAMLG
jgi:hypothetical protein